MQRRPKNREFQHMIEQELDKLRHMLLDTESKHLAKYPDGSPSIIARIGLAQAEQLQGIRKALEGLLDQGSEYKPRFPFWNWWPMTSSTANLGKEREGAAQR